MGRIVLLVTSPRVAPGLLAAASWRRLAAASAVLAGAGHRQAGALAAEGIDVDVVEDATPEAVAVRLAERAEREPGEVIWLCAPDGDPAVVTVLGERAELLVGSADVPGSKLLDLVAVMDRLRSPGGCPWDAAQTHESLLPYLLEEAYELVEAVEASDRPALREELGDVLLQVVFHARMAAEHPTEPWDVDDVATDIAAKLVRRHPHVFADGVADTAAEVEASWETLKRVEKGRTSAVDGVPLAQPALALTAKLMSRADKSGLVVSVPGALSVEAVGVEALGVEAVGIEGQNAWGATIETRSSEEIGDLLLAVVALARASGVDPEAALRATARRYAEAIKAAESTESSP